MKLSAAEELPRGCGFQPQHSKPSNAAPDTTEQSGAGSPDHVAVASSRSSESEPPCKHRKTILLPLAYRLSSSKVAPGLPAGISGTFPGFVVLSAGDDDSSPGRGRSRNAA